MNILAAILTISTMILVVFIFAVILLLAITGISKLKGRKMKYILYKVREYPNGNKFWFKDDKIHREDDKPAMEFANGAKAWYKNGKWHRENGPAIIKCDGTEYYYLNDVWYSKEDHAIQVSNLKDDKPTVKYDSGNKYWYKDGKYHTEKQWLNRRYKDDNDWAVILGGLFFIFILLYGLIHVCGIL